MCRTPFLPSMDQAACEKGAQAVRSCSQKAAALVAGPIQCSGGQRAVYGAHPGCEAGTCKTPTPSCEVLLTGWHCVCAAGQLFDSTRSECVAAKKDTCVAQHTTRSGTSSGFLPIVVASTILKECYGGQTAVYGAHYACEEKTCRNPTAVCELLVTDWHCVCPGEGQLFDTARSACVSAEAQSCAVQRTPPSTTTLILAQTSSSACEASCADKCDQDLKDDEVSLESCKAGCKLPNAARAAQDEVDEYCHTLTSPKSVIFAACEKGADQLRSCEAGQQTTMAGEKKDGASSCSSTCHSGMFNICGELIGLGDQCSQCLEFSKDISELKQACGTEELGAQAACSIEFCGNQASQSEITITV